MATSESFAARDVRSKVIRQLNQQIDDAFATAKLASSKVALLDFPRHTNAGDSLIWLGARAVLHRTHAEVLTQADQHWIPDWRIDGLDKDVKLILPGGGNFGDRYTAHHRYRLDLFARWRDRAIVQLPQSFEFISTESLVETQRAIEQHPNTTLMWREAQQARLASDMFPTATNIFCPDLALGLGDLASPRTATGPPLLLARLDGEATGLRSIMAGDTADLLYDWKLPPWLTPMWAGARMPENVFRVLQPSGIHADRAATQMITLLARLNLRNARTTFARASMVITDRLHGMILGALMGKRTFAVDNINGKVGNIFHDYVGNFPNVHLVPLESAWNNLTDERAASTK